jgi:hypothetical protein
MVDCLLDRHPSELWLRFAGQEYSGAELSRRVTIFSNCFAFEGLYANAIAGNQGLLDACQMILGSASLTPLLRKLKALTAAAAGAQAVAQALPGQHVQAQAAAEVARKDANQASLSGLLRQSMTTGADGRTSVLDCLVRSLQAGPESGAEPLRAPEELAAVCAYVHSPVALRTATETVERALESLHNALVRVCETVETDPRLAALTDKFAAELDRKLQVGTLTIYMQMQM